MHIYFKGLNGIRFFAAFMVVFGHIDTFKKKAGLFGLHSIPSLKQITGTMGEHGVKIFFVLSGFLITYLILSEHQKTSNIEIRKFYIRRILRIWPLYFLIVFLGFFVLPYCLDPVYFPTKTNPDFLEKLLCVVFFLPNLVLYAYGSIFTIGVLWSIGTEEQFYIFWPVFLKRLFKRVISGKSVLISFVVLLIFIIATKTTLWIWEKKEASDFLRSSIRVIYQFLQYDAMIIGGIFAVSYFYFKEKLHLLYSPVLQVICYLTIALNLFFSLDLGPLTNLVFCPIYAILILNISTNDRTVIDLDNSIFDFLGQISFGIYMYHSIAIVIALQVFNYVKESVLSYNILVYTTTFGLTLLISTTSYYLFERRILKYKFKFMVVESGKVI